jgi:hypothetical protein
MLKWALLFSLFARLVLCETECPIVTNIGDRRSDKTKLRLVQYNVEWLFIDYYSPMNCPGDGCTWKNLTDAQNHMDVVAKRIKEVNPDIINFCEVEGCDELNMLKDKLDGTYNSYLKKALIVALGKM